MTSTPRTRADLKIDDMGLTTHYMVERIPGALSADLLVVFFDHLVAIA
jgi:hypothetical protein